MLPLFQGNRYEQEKLLKQSCTLYVGNLSFYTTEEQVRSAAFERLAARIPSFLDIGLWMVSSLSFVDLTVQQVQELFSKSGDVKRIIIGLDKVKKTACGFCFVEYPLTNAARSCSEDTVTLSKLSPVLEHETVAQVC